MPHAGLMNERLMDAVEGPLLRARLHVRGGLRRLRQGKISAGIVTLYDALEAAMQAYIADPAAGASLSLLPGENLNDEKTLFRVLVRSHVLDRAFDFEAFDRLTEKALHEELPPFDYRMLVDGLEHAMIRLGVMPFDESSLPAEDPAAF
jgi:hypothetical protein